MVDVVKNNLDKIQQVCKQMGVKSLYLFGSGTTAGKFNNNSDVDFLIRFHLNSEGLHSTSYDYFDVLFALEDITGREVDLVAEERIENRFFRASVEKNKELVYES